MHSVGCCQTKFYTIYTIVYCAWGETEACWQRNKSPNWLEDREIGKLLRAGCLPGRSSVFVTSCQRGHNGSRSRPRLNSFIWPRRLSFNSTMFAFYFNERGIYHIRFRPNLRSNLRPFGNVCAAGCSYRKWLEVKNNPILNRWMGSSE